jgi:hypothetical protein
VIEALGLSARNSSARLSTIGGLQWSGTLHENDFVRLRTVLDVAAVGHRELKRSRAGLVVGFTWREKLAEAVIGHAQGHAGRQSLKCGPELVQRHD